MYNSSWHSPNTTVQLADTNRLHSYNQTGLTVYTTLELLQYGGRII